VPSKDLGKRGIERSSRGDRGRVYHKWKRKKGKCRASSIVRKRSSCLGMGGVPGGKTTPPPWPRDAVEKGQLRWHSEGEEKRFTIWGYFKTSMEKKEISSYWGGEKAKGKDRADLTGGKQSWQPGLTKGRMV